MSTRHHQYHIQQQQPQPPPPPPPPPTPPVRQQSLMQQQHHQQHPLTSYPDDDVILSNRGTVRGHRSRVRASLHALEERQQQQQLVASGPSQQDLEDASYDVTATTGVVLYATSLAVVRATHEACQCVRRILRYHRVAFEERDLAFSRAWRAACSSAGGPPLLYVDGALLGGQLEVERLNETGQLARLLAGQPRATAACDGCGGVNHHRHVVCPACRGSRRQRRVLLTAGSGFHSLRCTACDATGVVPCQLCGPLLTAPAAAAAAVVSVRRVRSAVESGSSGGGGRLL